MVRVELKYQRDFSDITLVFNHLSDSFKLELRGKGTFSPTSFDHASPHFHCFNINRISRYPELPNHYIHGLRVSELLSLQLMDYDPLASTLSIWRLKGGFQPFTRSVPNSAISSVSGYR